MVETSSVVRDPMDSAGVSRSRLTRLGCWLAGLAGVLLLFYGVVGYFGCANMFGDHPRWRGMNRGPADFGLRGETVSFTSQDGIPLKAWWLPANGTPRGAVIIATGSITRDKSCCRVQLFSSMWWAKFVLLGLGNACTSLPTPEHQRTEHRDVVPTTSLDHLFCRRILSLRARIRR